ncbi:MAG: calcium/sodium antiporter [Clostridia bacterium]|nr:calcium/sodium antiporter [Clostridia bacterium]
MENVLAIFLFLVGFGLLIEGGDWFVDGAVGIAHRFHLPELLIGATVVAIGTTVPEVMVSSISAIEGQGATAYGNAVGSIICNAALIAALTMAIRPAKVSRSSFAIPVCFFAVALVVYLLAAYVFDFTRWIGITLLAIFAVYMVYSIISAKKTPEKGDEEMEDFAPSPLWKDILLLIIGAVAIAVGAYLLVNNGKKIAEWIGVPESVIAITLIALGTSLPELVTAVVALAKGHSALSLGNIIGANLFNLVLVAGVSTTISPFSIAEATENTKQIAGMSSGLVVELPLVGVVMAILAIPTLIKGKVYRAQGIILLLLYAAFCVYQFAF